MKPTPIMEPDPCATSRRWGHRACFGGTMVLPISTCRTNTNNGTRPLRHFAALGPSCLLRGHTGFTAINFAVCAGMRRGQGDREPGAACPLHAGGAGVCMEPAPQYNTVLDETVMAFCWRRCSEQPTHNNTMLVRASFGHSCIPKRIFAPRKHSETSVQQAFSGPKCHHRTFNNSQ